MTARRCRNVKNARRDGLGDIYASAFNGRLIDVPTPTQPIIHTSTTMRTPRIFSLTTRSTTDSYTYYHYSPSLPLAATFTALFTLLTFTHLFRLQRSKTYFMIPLAIGAVFEATGYATRIPSAFEAPGPYSLAPYLVSAVLILIAPTLMAASIYMELGRIVRMVRAEDLIVIRRGWLTKVSWSTIRRAQ